VRERRVDGKKEGEGDREERVDRESVDPGGHG